MLTPLFSTGLVPNVDWCMSHADNMDFYMAVFGDTEFSVPVRYTQLMPKGLGAQGMVW